MDGAEVEVGDVDAGEAVGGDALEDPAHVIRAIGARGEDVVDVGHGAVDLGGSGYDRVVHRGGGRTRAGLAREGTIEGGGEVEGVDDGRE